jgi:hypothetical protein
VGKLNHAAFLDSLFGPAGFHKPPYPRMRQTSRTADNRLGDRSYGLGAILLKQHRDLDNLNHDPPAGPLKPSPILSVRSRGFLLLEGRPGESEPHLRKLYLRVPWDGGHGLLCLSHWTTPCDRMKVPPDQH